MPRKWGLGQGENQDKAVEKLKEAIESLQEAPILERPHYQTSVSIKELHEFLTIESEEPTTQVYEFRAVQA